MKKISILLALVMVISVFSVLSVHAGPNYILEIDEIGMPEALPTVDGVISKRDGYSAPADFNYDTTAPSWGFNAMTNEGKYYFAYSAKGIYIAGEMVELSQYTTTNQNGDLTEYNGNSFIYSTENDALIGTDKYSFNGDVVTFMIDPAGELLKAGFVTNDDHTPWYNIALFEDGTAKLARSQVNDAILSDDPANGVKVAAKVNTFDDEIKTGWTFEAFIPWNIIADDINAISGGAVTLDPAALAEKDYKFNAAVMYMDRFFDVEASYVDTWGRWITVCNKTYDGIPGPATSCDIVKSLGLKLVNGVKKVNPYIDLPEGTWYTDACLWCADNGFMTGTSATTFSPSGTLTRAQFVQVLARVAEVDLNAVEYKAIFSDVPDGQWYSKAVTWAVDFGVTGGVGDGLFAPNASVTRQQLAVFMRTFAEKSGKEVYGRTDITKYADYDSVAAWAVEAMSWAVKENLMSGTDATHLSPSMATTRAQEALIIKKFCENILSNKYKHVIVIGLDGAGNFFKEANAPNIQKMFKEGAGNDTVLTAEPTISAQCWGTMLTGVSPEGHGLNNSIVESGAAYENAEHPTVFKLIRNAMPNAVLASYCDWDPISSGIVERDLGVDTDTDSDPNLCNKICDYIKENRPDFMFIQFDSLDATGHNFGYGSDMYFKQFWYVDGYIGAILSAINEAGIKDDTLVIVSADHGGTYNIYEDGTSNGSHGGQSDTEKYVFFVATGKTVIPGATVDLTIKDIPAIVTHALGVPGASNWEAELPVGLFNE